NRGHLALGELERRGKLDTLITQNVNGLHLDAGHDPDRAVEVHGTLREVVCMSCGERRPMQHALDRVRAGEDDPHCLTCGGILKSATISFGQNLDPDDLDRASAAARRADLLLAVGSTLSVHPVADVVPIARMSGARIVIVNGGETAMDHLADLILRGSISPDPAGVDQRPAAPDRRRLTSPRPAAGRRPDTRSRRPPRTSTRWSAPSSVSRVTRRE